MTLPTLGRLLAIDLGDRRHGLARCDPLQTVAHPLITVPQRAGKRFPYAKVEPHLREAVGVVVGLPLTADGTEGPRAQEARRIAELIARRSGLPVALWDERFTTARVLRTTREVSAPTRGRGKRADVDPLAAAALLQHYLDTHRPAES